MYYMYFSLFPKPNQTYVWPRFQSLLKLPLWIKGVDWVSTITCKIEKYKIWGNLLGCAWGVRECSTTGGKRGETSFRQKDFCKFCQSDFQFGWIWDVESICVWIDFSLPKVCSEVPRNVCNQVPREVCENVPKQVIIIITIIIIIIIITIIIMIKLPFK